MFYQTLTSGWNLDGIAKLFVNNDLPMKNN